MVLTSLRDALVDADGELRAFQEDQAQVYDPGKRIRGENWDPDAPGRARKHFRLLLISLQASLDATADLAALFLTGLIPGLRVGRAQFSRIETWLGRALPPAGLIIYASTGFLGTAVCDVVTSRQRHSSGYGNGYR
jgi:hypothetical protein